jgi:hypothetical protein
VIGGVLVAVKTLVHEAGVVSLATRPKWGLIEEAGCGLPRWHTTIPALRRVVCGRRLGRCLLFIAC